MVLLNLAHCPRWNKESSTSFSIPSPPSKRTKPVIVAPASEAAGAAYMRHPEIEIEADLGVCDGAAEVWTCDLTHRYIEINADYRS